MSLLNDRGLAFEKNGEYSRAIESYGKAIAALPSSVAYYNRGNVYVRLLQYDRAIQDYQKAIELNPQYSEAYNNLGKLYFQIGQNGLAELNYQQAINCNSHNHEALSNLGVLYTNEERFDDAIAFFDRAVRSHDPRKGYSYYYNRGIAYGSKGDVDRAIQDFSTAIESKPEFADAYYNRGIAYEKNGDTRAADEDFKMAEELKTAGAGLGDAVLRNKREWQIYKNRSR